MKTLLAVLAAMLVNCALINSPLAQGEGPSFKVDPAWPRPTAGRERRAVRDMAIDRQGNLYTSEVGFGRRVQKFALVSF